MPPPSSRELLFRALIPVAAHELKRQREQADLLLDWPSQSDKSSSHDSESLSEMSSAITSSIETDSARASTSDDISDDSSVDSSIYGLDLMTGDSDNIPDVMSSPVMASLMHFLGNRYISSRIRIPKTRTQLDLILGDYKSYHPKDFRRWVRVDAETFDDIVSAVEHHPVFHNNSHYEQKSVPEQVAIGLHRFGVYGSAAALRYVANHFGVSPGMVEVATRRFMVAVLDSKYICGSVAWPSASNRLKAKKQVADKCGGNATLSQGWLMVDGTHINIFQKPNFYGDRFYDRKANYSFNIQICCLPSGEIIDYAVGDLGSANDSTGIRRTKLYKDQMLNGPKVLLDENEFCWGDSGYPLHSWLVIPFPRGDVQPSSPEGRFNVVLGQVRVAAEHGIGYLKGRFQSLKELRILITRGADIKYATLWIRACIHLHMFAFHRERDPNLLTDEWAKDGRQWERIQRAALLHTEQQNPKRQHVDFGGAAADGTQTKRARELELGQARAFRGTLVASLPPKAKRNARLRRIK